MKEKKNRIIPNTYRILVRRIEVPQVSHILTPGQLKAGENLLAGIVIHPGDSKFKKGQLVYYSEYSASAVFDIGAVLRGEKEYGEVLQDKLYIVAKEDVMAFEEGIYDPAKISRITQESRSKIADKAKRLG